MDSENVLPTNTNGHSVADAKGCSVLTLLVHKMVRAIMAGA